MDVNSLFQHFFWQMQDMMYGLQMVAETSIVNVM